MRAAFRAVLRHSLPRRAVLRRHTHVATTPGIKTTLGQSTLYNADIYTKYAKVPQGSKLLMIGFGSIGKGTLPLLLRHLDIRPEQIQIIAASFDEAGKRIAAESGISNVSVNPLTPENFRGYFDKNLKPGDFVLNVSVDVGSIDLINYCKDKGLLYLDTCIEPWLGGHEDPSKSASYRSNYGLRERAMVCRTPGAPTAVIAHGANPGMISHVAKQAIINVAEGTNHPMSKAPETREEWAQLVHSLGIKSIHIAEKDTQRSPTPREIGEFVNTWSVDGFVSEGCFQPSELGWGTHERHFPVDGKRHDFGCQAGIYLTRNGLAVRTRTWTPGAGPFHGFLVTHNESISMADYFSVKQGDKVVYRPTVQYSYHPCDDAVVSIHEAAGKGYTNPDKQRLMVDEITEGVDELGILLLGHKRGAYWYGSQLDVHHARSLAPYNNATSLQVAAGILAGVSYALNNPRQGMLEPDELPYKPMLEMMRPYLGHMTGVYSDWTPLLDRAKLQEHDDVDTTDPWQFKNFRVW